MGQNPETNRFEPLEQATESQSNELKVKFGELQKDFNMALLRPDGSPVPKHWTTFQIDELVVIKNYTYKVAYIGETSILFEPVSIELPK